MDSGGDIEPIEVGQTRLLRVPLTLGALTVGTMVAFAGTGLAVLHEVENGQEVPTAQRPAELPNDFSLPERQDRPTPPGPPRPSVTASELEADREERDGSEDAPDDRAESAEDDRPRLRLTSVEIDRPSEDDDVESAPRPPESMPQPPEDTEPKRRPVSEDDEPSEADDDDATVVDDEDEDEPTSESDATSTTEL
ncbi:hypothetical protein [Haloglycomyces albus]|uniref:hypothetical protein n=1 Tax=Haloglycomyces albus TaxID=526067 RepID=UPI00046D7759|nr:hypothetical protein [Haloglycomyces albus]